MARRSHRRKKPLFRRLFPFLFLALAILTGWALVAGTAPKHPPVTVPPAAAVASVQEHHADLTEETIIEGPATIVIEKGAEVRIRREGDQPAREIELRRGSVRVQVDPGAGRQFIIRTANATVGVRGTTFRVTVIGLSITRVSVEEGTVSVQGQTGDPILLGAGEFGEVVGASEAAKTGEPESETGARRPPAWNAETLRQITELSEALARIEATRRDGITLPAAGSSPTLSPDATATSRSRLAGTGSWTAENGLAGEITIVLEPISGRFTGSFTGQRPGERPLNVSGTASGALVGDAANGSLDGTFTCQADQGSGGPALPPLSGEATGTIRNQLVTGTLNAGAWRGSYELRLR